MKLEELKKSDVGRKVVYTPFVDCDPSLKEEGVITSWNDTFIFVRYGDEVHSKATTPSDIEFTSGG